ncbi:MAG: GNAT family N-acetyltransferase [Bdellovibrionales bacterium]|nr:GNAT family N-acetyltransferase [Oligoflexia bacterium]
MISEIQIEKAGLADSALLAEMGAGTFRETYVGMMQEADLNAYVSEVFSLSATEKKLSDPRAHFWIARKEGIPCGYCLFLEGNAPIELPERRVGEISRIYVQRRWHGAGIGPLLMEKMIALAESLQLSGTWLNVWEKNRLAQKFYEKQGYQVVGAQTLVVGTDSQQDAILFKKTRA